MQRNDIPVAQSTCKKVTAVAAVVSGHRARPADDSSWCRHQRPSVGERSRHLSDYIVRPAAYALRVLRAHGLPQQSLMDVYRATVQGKLLYAASAWSGFCTARDRVRLNSFLRRCWKLGYSNRSIAFEDMCAEADEQLLLFDRLINNTNHVLHILLPPPTTASERYKSRTHTLQLPEHSTRLSDSNFLVRMLYRDCY